MNLPRTIRFFRKPDHISFLVGFPLLLAGTATNIFEITVASFVFFSFTLAYEIFEIRKGNRDIFKLDHVTFVIGYALIIVTFWYVHVVILPIASVLMAFTLGYEVYRVRKLDLERDRKKKDNA